jgi:hypothetical protein
MAARRDHDQAGEQQDVAEDDRTAIRLIQW